MTHLWDGILFVSPMAALWCMGVNLLWGHVTTAARIWEAEREQREARRRLRRSVAAWEKFRAEYEGSRADG